MTKKTLGLLAFVVITLALLGYLAFSIGAIGGGGGDRYNVKLRHAAGLVQNNAVKIAGVKVGRIADIGVDHDVAALTLVLDRGTVLHEDARAVVRAKSLLGEKYLQLEPGTRDAGVLPPGSEITDAEVPFEIDEVLNALEPILGGEDSIAGALAPLARRLDSVLASAMGENGEEPVMSREQVKTMLADITATVASTRRMAEDNEKAVGELLQNTNKLLSDNRLPRIVRNVDALTAELNDKLPATLERADRALASLEKLADVVDDKRAAKIGRIIDDTEVAMKNLRVASKALADVNALMASLRSIANKADLINETVIRQFLQREGVKIYFGNKKEASKALGE